MLARGNCLFPPPTRASLFVQKKKFFFEYQPRISIRPVSSVKFVFDKFRSDADDQSMRRPSIHGPRGGTPVAGNFSKKCVILLYHSHCNLYRIEGPHLIASTPPIVNRDVPYLIGDHIPRYTASLEISLSMLKFKNTRVIEIFFFLNCYILFNYRKRDRELLGIKDDVCTRYEEQYTRFDFIFISIHIQLFYFTCILFRSSKRDRRLRA